ncbi:MAG: substrate-binding domain-containing protein [Oscillospiraceae bacterium]|jgi:phosphate transport system substrate-binding protein|nr:substrate-binding domain-containing protein [Oscillospiraceae bacterium]
MKRLLGIFAVAAVLLTGAAGCAKSDDSIYVLTREKSSGTRGAFVELTGLEGKDENGQKYDNTVDTAEVTGSTNVMLTTVAGDMNAIGYVSLGSLNGTVRAAKVDGVAPHIDTIRDGSYPIARPFHVVTKGELKPAAKAFLEYVLSTEGQGLVIGNGYVSIDAPRALADAAPADLRKQTITVTGSSSVTPLMEKLAEGFMARYAGTGVKVQVSGSDSTMGVTDVLEGRSDIGMASRELKSSETERGAAATFIAKDGIAVIVNRESNVSDLTMEQIKRIYLGELTRWAEVTA